MRLTNHEERHVRCPGRVVVRFQVRRAYGLDANAREKGHEACVCMREVSRSQQEEMSRNMHKRRIAKACEYVSPVKRRLSYSEHAIQCGLRDTVYVIVAPAGQGVPSRKSKISICVSGTELYLSKKEARRVPPSKNPHPKHSNGNKIPGGNLPCVWGQ
jgi:hypothetical protein